MPSPLAKPRGDDAAIPRALLMLVGLAAFAPGGALGPHDDAAGDPVAGVAGGLGHVIVGLCMHDDRGAIAVEDRFLAVPEREGVADDARAQRPIGCRELVRQIARMRAMFGEIAVHAVGVWREVGAGGGKAYFRIAIA